MRKDTGKKRRGAAIVEMAIVTPLMLMLLLGTIQYGYLFMVRQSIVRAAAEGARVATLPGATDGEIESAIDVYMSGAGLTGKYSVAIERAVPPDTMTEEVTVSIPFTAVSLVGDFFGSVDGKVLSSTSRQRRL